MIKDLQVAEATIKMTNDALATIDESARIVRRTSSDTEAKEYRFRVGEVVLYALDKRIEPIYDEHPELQPH
jgi:hypothetical protein